MKKKSRKNEYDFGYEYGELAASGAFGDPSEWAVYVDFEGDRPDIPTEDYRELVSRGIRNPSAKKYWDGFNQAIEDSE